MAVELWSENSGMAMSPRISFSHDLSQTDVVPVEQHLLRSNSSSSIDFDFCVFRESFDQESSSADELFSDGMILPIQIKKKIVPPPKRVQPPPPLPPPPPHEPHDIVNSSKTKKTKASNEMKIASSESDEKNNSKSFWRFKRSSSFNCGSGYAGGLCPLPLLSRSNSTGSAPSVKRSSLSKDSSNHKQHSQKTPSVTSIKPSQSPYSSTSNQRPPLKKTYGSYGNGVRINPVLNVPSANLFGLGSIFSGGKDKEKNKKK